MTGEGRRRGDNTQIPKEIRAGQRSVETVTQEEEDTEETQGSEVDSERHFSSSLSDTETCESLSSHTERALKE